MKGKKSGKYSLFALLAAMALTLVLPGAMQASVSPNVVIDTFARPNSTSLGSTEGAVYPWVKGSAETTASINNEMLAFGASTSSGEWGAAIDTFQPADVDVSVVMHMYDTGGGYVSAGISYRNSTDKGKITNGYFVMCSNGASMVLWHPDPSALYGGILVERAPSPVNWSAPGENHILRVRAIGNRHQVFVDGNLYIDYTDTSTVANNGPGYVQCLRNVGAATFQQLNVVKIDNPTATDALAGTITDIGTSAGIDGVALTLDGVASGTSNPDGTFSIAGVSAGQHILLMEKTGYLSQTRTILFDTTTPGTESLKMVPEATPFVNLTGTVTEQGTGTPISGAKVMLSTGASTTTNASGVYEFTGFTQPTIATITVADPNHYAQVANTLVDPAATKVKNFSLATVAAPSETVVDTFTRDDSASLGSTESPAYPWVTSLDEPSAAIATGQLSLGIPALADVGLGASIGGGFAAADVDVTVDMQIMPGGLSWFWQAGVAYRAPSPGTSSNGYYVAYSVAPDPPGTWLALIRNDNTWLTQAASPVDFTDGMHKLHVRAVGMEHTVWVDDDPTPVIDYFDASGSTNGGHVSLIRKNGSAIFDNLTVKAINSPGFGTISGIVTDIDTSTPVVGITVKLKDGASTVTGSDGRYALRATAYGSYTAMAYDDTHPGAIKPVTLSSPSTTLDFQVKTLPAPMTITDSFDRPDSTTDLGWTDAPNAFHWVAGPGESLASISGNQMRLGEGGGSCNGVGLAGIQIDNFDATVTMHCGQGSTAYIAAGIGYRDPGPGDGLTGRGYFTLDHLGVAMHLWRTDASVLAGAVWHNSASFADPLETHTLRVRAIGPHHQIWVDSTPLIDYIDWTGNNDPGFFSFLRNLGWATFDDLSMTVYQAPTGTITGHVTDAVTGAPVAGIKVLLKEGGSDTTIADGSYAITGNPYKSYTAIAYDDNHPGVIKPVTVGASSVTLDFQVKALQTPTTITDSFSRPDSTTDLGWTSAPNSFHWVPAPNETQASISGDQLRLSDPGGNVVGVGLAGVQTANLDMTVKMHCGVGGTAYVSAGVGYRDPGPGQGDVGRGYFTLSHLGVGMHLWRTDVTVLAGVVWQPFDYSNMAETHTLRVRAIGPHHQIWCDSTLLIDYIDWTGNNDPGHVSFLRNCGWAAFDDLNLTIYDKWAVTAFPSIKSLGDGASVAIGGGSGSPIVSKKYNGFFYVEDSSRACGIKVLSSAAVNVGDAVSVTGTLGTANGERFILANSVNAAGSGAIKPLGTPGKNVGSSVGTSTVGLLMTVWGTLSGPAGQPYAFVNDGSNADGIKISIPSGSISSAKYGKYVTCTGVVGMSAGSVPVVQLNSDTEIVVAN